MRRGGRIPDDVLVEILLRLPARSVLRCRAVCKSWRSLTSAESFRVAHAARATAVPIAVSSFYLDKTGSISPPRRVILFDIRNLGWFHCIPNQVGGSFVPLCVLLPQGCEFWPYWVVSSWDGILCLEISIKSHLAQLRVHSYVLFNPVSRACAVAALPGRGRGRVVAAYSHPVSGRFHLLHACKEKDEPIFQILQVGDSAWHEIPIPTSSIAAMLHQVVRDRTNSSGTSLHGNLHWQLNSNSMQWTILVFDTAKEEFGSMAAPECGITTMRRIGVLSGKLCVFASLPNMVMEMWVLQDYQQQSWQLKGRIGTAAVSDWLNLHWTQTKVMAVADAEDSCREIILHRPERVAVYNVAHKKWHLTALRQYECVMMQKESMLPHETMFGAASWILPESDIKGHRCSIGPHETRFGSSSRILPERDIKGHRCCFLSMN